MEDYIVGKYSIYHRKFNRKLKSGKSKIYTSDQHIVLLPDNELFSDNDHVIVMKSNRYNDLIKQIESTKKVQKDYDHVSELYENLQETNKILQNSLDRSINNHDHTKERLRVALEEISDLEKKIGNYKVVKESIKTTKRHLERKGKFTKWIAGLDESIMDLEINLKMLPDPDDNEKPTGEEKDQTDKNR